MAPRKLETVSTADLLSWYRRRDLPPADQERIELELQSRKELVPARPEMQPSLFGWKP